MTMTATLDHKHPALIPAARYVSGVAMIMLLILYPSGAVAQNFGASI
jgi:hypothetical protein